MDLVFSNDMFDLFINMQNFFKLPYRYDLTPEGTSTNSLVEEVIFDDVKITIPIYWSNIEFVRGMIDEFGGMQPQFTKA